MTLRLTLSFDPGLTGACAILADGRFFGCFDMPQLERGTTGQHRVDGAELARRVRAVRATEPGAYCSAIVEQVNAMPSIPGADGNRRTMGAASSFHFGVNFGVLLGVLQALDIPLVQVAPVRWKRAMNLNGTKKDAARLLALKLHPAATEFLSRKKDSGRADAILIGHWYCEREGWLTPVPKPRIVVPEKVQVAPQPELFSAELETATLKNPQTFVPRLPAKPF